MNEFDDLYEQAIILRNKYAVGTRVELVLMDNDPKPIPKGTRGTVKGIDDMCNILVNWDNGSSLSLIYGVDKFRVLSQEEIIAEQGDRNNTLFIDRLNSDVFMKIDWDKVAMSYSDNDNSYIGEILKMFHNTFVDVYGSDDVNGYTDFITVPAVLKGDDGEIYAGLVDIDLSSSGELWGAAFITPSGIVDQLEENPSQEHVDMMNHIMPYEYWYTVKYDRDIHVNNADMPSDIKEFINSYPT